MRESITKPMPKMMTVTEQKMVELNSITMKFWPNERKKSHGDDNEGTYINAIGLENKATKGGGEGLAKTWWYKDIRKEESKTGEVYIRVAGNASRRRSDNPGECIKWCDIAGPEHWGAYLVEVKDLGKDGKVNYSSYHVTYSRKAATSFDGQIFDV